MKQLILYVLFVNVFVAPWGLSANPRLGDVLLAIAFLMAKALGIALVVVVIESSFAKLRLYKIPEFTVASFLLAVLAIVTSVFEREFGGHLTVFGAFASVIAVTVLLLAFGMLRSQDVWEQLSLYAFGSAAVAALAFAAAASSGGGELFVLGAFTIAFKALAVPLGIGLIMRTLDVDVRVPSTLRAPSAVLLGILLAGFSFLALGNLEIDVGGSLPLSALAVSVAVVLVAFLLMIVRPYAPSQLLGFLVLENGVTLASLVIAPSLPLILALLLLFDVLVGVLVFVVLVQYFGLQRTAVTTDILQRLRG
jgi:hydrogenase-4 component E